jgi:hypothetical protein
MKKIVRYIFLNELIKMEKINIKKKTDGDFGKMIKDDKYCEEFNKFSSI